MPRDRTGSPGMRSSEELVGEFHHGVWPLQLLYTWPCVRGNF